ncbi:MAG: hypothetical protein Q9210_001389 [Variospora velana]
MAHRTVASGTPTNDYEAALSARYTSLSLSYFHSIYPPTPTPTHSSPSSHYHHHRAPYHPPTQKYDADDDDSIPIPWLLLLFLLLVMLTRSWLRRRRRQLTRQAGLNPLTRVDEEREEAAQKVQAARLEARKIEEAAQAARSRMKWLDDGVEGIRVDDRWRYRMEAERREREMRRRGVWVEEKVPEVKEVVVEERRVEDEVLVQIHEQLLWERISATALTALEVMDFFGHRVAELSKQIVKTGAVGCGVWLAYRLVRFFTKYDYEREGNRVDRLLSVGIHISATVFLTLTLPIGIAFAVRWLVVGHNDRVEVCNLCGRTPICQLQINHTNGVDLCLKCRLEHEDRIEGEKRLEAVKQRRAYEMGTTVEALEKKIKLRKAKEEAAAEEERYAQKASRLPSGQRSSPEPWSRRPRGQEVLDLLCNFEDAKAQYSGFPHRIPGQRQKLYNAFEAKQAFMTPIIEEGGYTGRVTRSMRKEMRSHKTWKDDCFAEADARLPAETRRVLWPQQPMGSKWEKTPNKRFS